MLRKFLLTLALCLPLAAAAQETPDALVKRVTDEVLAVIGRPLNQLNVRCA